MGGCRCTYRNCTVKSDGKTHMFHYPVFEKVRCHKWLLNAYRLEFLNLKVSQLKNRVVCQHHFKEECFMNYKKEKLTFDAIPTEDGPFCDSSKYSIKLPDEEKTYPIILEDIENDCLPFCEKKANFSLKYGDFLTNCELMDFDDIELQNNMNLKNECTILQSVITDLNGGKIISLPKKKKPLNNTKLVLPLKNTKLVLPLKNKNKKFYSSIVKVQPFNDVNSCVKKPHDLAQGKTINSVNTNDATTVENIIKKDTEIRTPIGNIIKKEPKIRIISEKKIEEPIILSGNFTKLSPSRTLIPSSSNNSLKEENKDNLETIKNSVSALALPMENSYTVHVEYDPLQLNIPNVAKSNANECEIVQSVNVTKQQTDDAPPESKILLLKNKITPERMAIIENKRKFNMKLKNIIEACLDNKNNVVEADKPKQEKIRNTFKKKLATNPISPSVKVQSCLPSEPTLPNVHDNTIAYLEDRLKRMENTLLSKIDQNTERISELKTCMGTQGMNNVKKVDTYAQTSESEESYKRFLFCEISKYLSTSCNSAIYEELFINKFSLENSGYSLRNKRKKCS